MKFRIYNHLRARTTQTELSGAAITWVVSANMWHITFQFLNRPFFLLYSWDHAQPALLDVSWQFVCYFDAFPCKDVHLWVTFIFTSFCGSVAPKTHIWGWIGIFKPNKQNIQTFILLQWFKMLHSDKGHQVLFVDGLKLSPTNQRKKKWKLLYLSNNLTDFDDLYVTRCVSKQGYTFWRSWWYCTPFL